MKLTSLSTIAAFAALPLLFTACDDGADTGDDAADDSTQEAGADDDAADDDAADDDAADDDAADDDAADDDAADDDAADDGADAGDDAVEGDAGDDAVEGDAGDDAAEGDAGGGEGGGETKFGSIALSQIAGTSFASASFVISTSSGGGGDNPCETETVDSCTLVVCALDSDAEGGAVGESQMVSAGDLTFTGLDAELAATFDEVSGVYSGFAVGSIWSESTEVTVDVSGSDDVPAFSLALTVPDAVTFTAPVANEMAAFDASRADDFEVTWDGGGEGLVSVALNGSTEEELVAITCSGPAADGSLVVDASLLEALPASGALSTTVGTSAVGSPGDDWTIVFSGSLSGPSGVLNLTD